MPVEILMPALSPTMTEGNLARWLKQEGETVSPGDILAEIETDKATMEIEAIDEGTLGRIVVPDGTEGVSVNTVIALLLTDGEDSAELAASPAPALPEPNDVPAIEVADAGPDSSRPLGQGLGNVPPPPVSMIAPDPDVPVGTEMVELTVREALRDAMAEEMRRRSRRVFDWRRSRRIPGRLQGQPGIAGGIRRPAGDRHSNNRGWVYRLGGRRGIRRPEANRRIHDL